MKVVSLFLFCSYTRFTAFWLYLSFPNFPEEQWEESFPKETRCAIVSQNDNSALILNSPNI